MTKHGNFRTRVNTMLFLAFGIFPAAVVHAQTQYSKVNATVQCRGLNGASTVLSNLARAAVRLTAPISKATAVRLTDATGVIEIPYRSYDLAPQLEIIYKAKITTTLPGGG